MNSNPEQLPKDLHRKLTCNAHKDLRKVMPQEIEMWSCARDLFAVIIYTNMAINGGWSTEAPLNQEVAPILSNIRTPDRQVSSRCA